MALFAYGFGPVFWRGRFFLESLGALVVGVGGAAEFFFGGASFFAGEDFFADAAGHDGGDAGLAFVVQAFEFSAQEHEGDLFVAILAALALADDFGSGRAVAQAHGGFAAVDVLAAFAAGAEGLDVALGEEFVVVEGNFLRGHGVRPSQVLARDAKDGRRRAQA